MFENPWLILILLIAFFGFIVIGIILVKKFVLNKNKDKKEEIDQDKIREEELNRILEPITDEESLKAMEEIDKNE